MKSLKEQIKVMQHYANGGEVEIRDSKFPNKNFEHLPQNGHGFNFNGHSFNFMEYDYRIKEEKKTIIMEKWLVQDKSDGEFFIIETSDISIKVRSGAFEKIKLLESYEVEV